MHLELTNKRCFGDRRYGILESSVGRGCAYCGIDHGGMVEMVE